jgi:hypothetical protein
MKGGRHLCAAVQCEEQIPAYLLMCPAHWRQVPRELQQTVVSAWKELKQTEYGTEEHAAAYAHYHGARAAAVRVVSGG